MCKRLLVLALVAMLSPAVLGDILVDDRFDDGDIGTNTMGIGTGFNAGTWSTGTAVTESGGTVILENSEVGWARAAITSKEGADLWTASAQYMFLGVTFSQSPNGWDWGGSTDRLALGVKANNVAEELDAGVFQGFWIQFESDSLTTWPLENYQFNGISTLFYKSAGGVATQLASWTFDTLNWDDWANFEATANFTPVLDLILELSPTGYSLTIVGDTITLLSGSLSNTYAEAGITNELTAGYAFGFAQTENPSLFTSVDQIIIMGVKPVNPGTEGLVAYYALENDANDSSGNELHGTFMGDPNTGEPNFVAGHDGMALDLDGVDDYVDCSYDPLFDVTGNEITVSAWVTIRSIPTAWMSIAAKGEYAWRLGNANMDPRFHFGITIWNAPDTASQDGVTAVGYDEWHHVAGVFDGANIMVYLDGVLDASSPTTEPIGINDKSMFIGNNPDAPDRYWNGLIDELKIYDRALSADEIAFLADN
jgi:hypothetical protein